VAPAAAGLQPAGRHHGRFGGSGDLRSAIQDQVVGNPPKPKREPLTVKIKYAVGVTVCIAAVCSEGEKELIVLCSDRRISYGVGIGGAEIGFKLGLAGPGWAAMIAGTMSNAQRLLSFYRNHLNSVALTESNVRTEMDVPLIRYRDWLANRSRIAPDLVKFDEQLILSGYVEEMPFLFMVSCEGVDEHRHFAVIGTGSWLAQAALLQREYTSATDVEEALYLVYEAKKFSEKDDYVGKRTMILVQESPLNPTNPAVTVRTVSLDGLRHLVLLG